MADNDMTIEEARTRAREIVATVRVRGFKSGGGEQFSDAQIWQALLDAREWGGNYWDCAAGKLIEHVIEGREPPAAPQWPS